MPWGAIIGLGAGILGSRSAKKQQKKALEQERYFRERELGLAEDNMRFARETYDKHQQRWDPVLDELLQVYGDVEPDYGAIAGDVNMAYDTARGIERRNERRYGIRPDDGMGRQAEREYAIRRGASHVGQRTLARQGADDKKYARLADLYGIGQGVQSNAASMVTNANSAGVNAFGRAGNAAANNAGMWGQQAGADAAGWGAAIGGVDWGGILNSVKGWFNKPKGGGTMPTVPY